jgi:hypothetical protein
MRLWQGRDAHGSGQLGRRLNRYHSTEIPNIEVQFEALPAIRRMTQTPAFIKSFLGLGFMQTFLKAQVDRMPEGLKVIH